MIGVARRSLVGVIALLSAIAPASAVTFNEMWTGSRVEVAIFADPKIIGADVGWITVDVRDAAVTLRGAVADADSVERAAAAARAAGARTIRNELRVVSTPDVTLGDDVLRDQLRMALRHAPWLGKARISGRIADGVVTLTGRVADPPTRALASRLARRVPGVKAVDNQLWTDSVAMLGGR